MAHVRADRIYERSTTAGLSAYTLNGAKDATYRTFGSACANGDTVDYCAFDSTNGGWEVGIGTWGTGGTLTRTTILGSSNANAAVDWPAGTREVFLTTTAERAKKDAIVCLPIACSDEGTAITAGTAKITFHQPFDMTLTEAFIGLNVAQVSGNIFTVDVNEAGNSILSTKLTIDNGEDTSLTASTPAVISDAFLAKGSKMTVDIDQIGNGTAKGLKLYLIGVVK